jgi:hypothetical protein
MPLKSSITSCVYWSWSLSGWPPVPAIVSIQKVACVSVTRAFPTPGSLLAVRKAVFAVPPPPLMTLLVVEIWRNVLLVMLVPCSDSCSAFLEDAVGVLDDGLQVGLCDARGLLAKLRRDRQVELGERQRDLAELGVGGGRRVEKEREDIVVRDVLRAARDHLEDALCVDYGPVRD